MDWAKTDGLVIAVQHEPLHFTRRAGYAGVDAELDWNRLHTEETVKNLANNGCNFIRMHFFKGSGYIVEAEEMHLVKAFSEWCHKYGVKLQLYIQFGTLSADTFAEEEPDFLDWVQKDRFGEPLRLLYGNQTYRYPTCHNSPGYWDYLEKVVEDGIVNYNADAIGFDNIGFFNAIYNDVVIDYEACHCNYCRSAFVEFIKERYSDQELAKERFGHNILEHIVPPYWNFGNNPSYITDIHNPSIQEWIWFRNESTRRVVKRMYDVCKKFNPDILVEINAYKHTGYNSSFCQGLFLPDLADGMDAFWDESDPQPRYEDGILHHRVRSYKTARALGKLCFTSQNTHIRFGKMEDRRARLSFAENMAFHYGYISGVANALPIADGLCVHGAYKEFEKKHKELYQAIPRYSFAVYESKHSFSLSNFDYHYANIVMTQAILRGKLLYCMIMDLDDLNKHAAVILAGCACLSDEEIDKLVDYVKSGGSLVITGRTGTCDLWNRSRNESDTLRAKLRLGEPEDGVNTGIMRYTSGTGKVLDIPCFETEKTFLDCKFSNYTAVHVPFDCWTAPKNMSALLDGLNWVSPGELTISGPESLICELTEDDNNIYVHLLNYDFTRALSGIGVSLKIGFKNVKQLFPLTSTERVLTARDGVVTVDMEDVYTILRFEK